MAGMRGRQVRGLGTTEGSTCTRRCAKLATFLREPRTPCTRTAVGGALPGDAAVHRTCAAIWCGMSCTASGQHTLGAVHTHACNLDACAAPAPCRELVQTRSYGTQPG